MAGVGQGRGGTENIRQTGAPLSLSGLEFGNVSQEIIKVYNSNIRIVFCIKWELGVTGMLCARIGKNPIH